MLFPSQKSEHKVVKKLKSPLGGEYSETLKPNLECNDCELMYSRLRNLKVREKFLNLLLNSQMNNPGEFADGMYTLIRTPFFHTFLQDVQNPVDVSIPKELRDMVNEAINESSAAFYNKTPYSKELLSRILDLQIEISNTYTKVDLSKKSVLESTMEKGVVPNWGKKLNAKVYPLKAMNVAVAHEKGHMLRKLDFSLAGLYFNQGLNFMFIENLEDREYMQRPNEIMERISQIKNYFGFSGDEALTKEHIVFAELHYVNDIGFDNNMTDFFRGIKDGDIEKFLEVTNSCGV